MATVESIVTSIQTGQAEESLVLQTELAAVRASAAIGSMGAKVAGVVNRFREHLPESPAVQRMCQALETGDAAETVKLHAVTGAMRAYILVGALTDKAMTVVTGFKEGFFDKTTSSSGHNY